MPIWERMKKIRDSRNTRLRRIMYEKLYKKFNSNKIAEQFVEAFQTFCNGYKKQRRESFYKHTSVNFKSIKRVRKEFEVLWRKSKMNQTHSKIAAACGLKVHDITMLLKKFKTGAWYTET